MESDAHEEDACSRLFGPDALWDPKGHRPEEQSAEKWAPESSLTVCLCSCPANSVAWVSATGEYCTQQRPDKISTE